MLVCQIAARAAAIEQQREEAQPAKCQTGAQAEEQEHVRVRTLPLSTLLLTPCDWLSRQASGRACVQLACEPC